MTGWVQWFLSNCRLPKDLHRKDGSLMSDEITAAETFWIRVTNRIEPEER